MTNSKTQAEIIDDFFMFDDWMEKYQYIIDMGKSLEKLSEEDKVDDNKLRGCQSQVWITHNFESGKLYFQAESDAAIVSGLIALVLGIYSGHSPKTIVETPPDFISEIGLDKHLSPTRSNGLASLLNKIKETANSYL